MTVLINSVLRYPLHTGALNALSSSQHRGLVADLRHPHTAVLEIYSLGWSPSSREGQMTGSEPPGKTGGSEADVRSTLKSHCWYRISDIYFSLNVSVARWGSWAAGCCKIIWMALAQLFSLYELQILMLVSMRTAYRFQQLRLYWSLMLSQIMTKLREP